MQTSGTNAPRSGSADGHAQQQRFNGGGGGGRTGSILAARTAAAGAPYWAAQLC